MLKMIGAALIAASLAGCVTTEDAEQARFRAFNGQTMADFIASSLIVPYTYSEGAGGSRVFVGVRRGAGPAFDCTVHVSARNDGAGDAPRNWIVTGIQRQGNCSQV